MPRLRNPLRQRGQSCHRQLQDLESGFSLGPTPLLPNATVKVWTSFLACYQHLLQMVAGMMYQQKLALRRSGCGLDTSDVGTHSLKRALLTWCAKYGLDLPTRSLLGYHVSTEHSSAMVYYRDAMAGPLRCLDVVLLAVRKKDFHPDKTRSGYLPGKRQLFIEPQPKTKAGPPGSGVWTRRGRLHLCRSSESRA